MYTRASPQRLVNSFRKRQYHNTSVVLKELWTELEKRYGNTAIITNCLLARLKELAKFGEQEKGKLQVFSDLCIDVASQIDQLPVLGCDDDDDDDKLYLTTLTLSAEAGFHNGRVKKC